jgi:biofilm protein TabA
MRKIFFVGFILVIYMSNLMTNTESQAQTNNLMTEKETTQWFDKGEWLDALKLKPHQSINKTEFAKQYQAHRERWDQAFAYLKNTDLENLKPGTYKIDGENVFAIVAENKKKDYEETKWESHLKYQDIQIVIKGKEKIGVTNISTLTITEPYEDAKDVMFYSGAGKGEIHLAEPGTFFIFFPNDGHRPDIKVDGYETDKKIVIKVKTEG